MQLIKGCKAVKFGGIPVVLKRKVSRTYLFQRGQNEFQASEN